MFSFAQAPFPFPSASESSSHSAFKMKTWSHSLQKAFLDCWLRLREVFSQVFLSPWCMSLSCTTRFYACYVSKSCVSCEALKARIESHTYLFFFCLARSDILQVSNSSKSKTYLPQGNQKIAGIR